MLRAHRRDRRARRPTPTTRSAGRTRCARRTSGPSRSPRTGAAPATARSSTGPAGSRAKGELRHQFCHVIDVAPTILEAAGLPEPAHGPRRHAGADGGHEHGATASTTPPPPSATRRSTSRCSATAASTTRAGRRSPSTARPGTSATSRSPSTTTSGSSTTAAATGRRRTTSSAEQPDKLHELQRLFLIEAARYNVLPLDDRQAERDHARRSPAARR